MIAGPTGPILSPSGIFLRNIVQATQADWQLPIWVTPTGSQASQPGFWLINACLKLPFFVSL
jgi:hypothetical protein